MHVEVAVPKAKVVSTFKALVALKQQIGFQTSKKDITLQPSGYGLQTAMEHLVIQMLQERGWHSLQPNLLLSMLTFRTPITSLSAAQCVMCCTLHPMKLLSWGLNSDTTCHAGLVLQECIIFTFMMRNVHEHCCAHAGVPFLEAELGSVTACAYLSIYDSTVQRPSRLLITLQTGKRDYLAQLRRHLP